jgi:hypothetical protein
MRLDDKTNQERGGAPAIVSRSGPLPAVMHLCSYACSHTPESTCGLVPGTEHAARREPAEGDNERRD